MKIKRAPAPAIFDLTRPWSIDCTLAAPDPTGYQAVILDETGMPIARSLREPAPIDFMNRRFNFVFVPPITLDYTAHTYRIVVEGPSGARVPFVGLAMTHTYGIQIGCPRCHGTGTTTDTRMQCPDCIPTQPDPDEIPF